MLTDGFSYDKISAIKKRRESLRTKQVLQEVYYRELVFAENQYRGPVGMDLGDAR